MGREQGKIDPVPVPARAEWEWRPRHDAYRHGRLALGRRHFDKTPVGTTATGSSRQMSVL
jgi:hypothetical protein